jgi:hypothetical protein
MDGDRGRSPFNAVIDGPMPAKPKGWRHEKKGICEEQYGSDQSAAKSGSVVRTLLCSDSTK